MAERSLSLPVSGDEIIESICAAVARVLRRDCFLSPQTAYSEFEADISWSVKMTDLGRQPEVVGGLKVQEGTVDPEKERQAKEGALRIEPAPPNQVREEADLPIPTLTTGTTGKPEIRPVSYKKAGTFGGKDKIASNEERIKQIEKELGEQP